MEINLEEQIRCVGVAIEDMKDVLSMLGEGSLDEAFHCDAFRQTQRELNGLIAARETLKEVAIVAGIIKGDEQRDRFKTTQTERILVEFDPTFEPGKVLRRRSTNVI